MNAIQITDVTKTFGQHVAVDRLSLAVPTGSIYGFIGPNGSGKTTTLRMIMRIFQPDSGSITVLGHDGAGVLDQVSYLPEERMLYKSMRVYDVLRFFANLKGYEPPKGEIDAWLEKMFPGEGSARIHQLKVEALSKGMTQKVQLIATLISKPKVVLLDEPFSGLDPVNAVTLRDAILDLRRSGTTVIFSTHDMSVAEKMCDFIFMIYKGRKVLDGTLASIQQQYGRDIIRVRLAQNANGDLSHLPGVASVADHGNLKELRITPSAQPQEILQQLAAHFAVEHFEVTAPSLQDIFVRIAAPQQASEKVMA